MIYQASGELAAEDPGFGPSVLGLPADEPSAGSNVGKKEEASRTWGAIEKKNKIKTKPSPKKGPFPKAAQAPAEDADHERNPWIMSQDVRRMIYLLPNL